MVRAIEAGWSFAALLDEVEGGEIVVITRGGRRIASLGPAPTGNGEALRALLSRAVDPAFADAVRSAGDAAMAEDSAWPAD